MNFDCAFDNLSYHEGGYVNNPADPGGETKYGISKRSYPKLDIKNLTREQAKAIYFSDFWGPLPKGVHDTVKFHLFDLAVNSGHRLAIQMLQTAVDVAPDGAWGPKSQAAYDSRAPISVAIALTAERLLFMVNLNGWSSFSRGWSRRLAANLVLISKEVK